MHTPVLLHEVLEYLKPVPGGQYIDATLNGGGHALAIVERIQPDGKVLGIEWDSSLLAQTQLLIATEIPGFAREPYPRNYEFKKNLTLVNDSYVNLKKIAEAHKIVPDGILFDLGLSSWHYEASGRGFTFKKNEPLDMRFNPLIGTPASEIVNLYSVAELEKILREYGDEEFSESISESIGLNRKKKPIMSTEDLVAVISVAVPDWYKKRKIHFATKTFQALRVAVNNELSNVKEGVEAAIDILKPGGRLVVISFQGHEDKIIREIFKEQVKAGRITQPVKGTVRPSWSEQQANPKSRSAKMKVAEKI